MVDESNARVSIPGLILVPAVISLAVTLLRLYGELQHWPTPWFNNTAGGGGAIIGISWLPFIFGPYFAMRLSKAGLRPGGSLKTILLGFFGIVLVIGGAIIAFSPPIGVAKFAAGVLAMVVGAALQFIPWPALAKTLIAYGFAARIPVVLVMFAAIQGRWGTHYDILPPGYTGPTTPGAEFVFIGLIPQMLLWVPFTAAVGGFAGGIASAAIRRSPGAAPADLKTQS